MQQSGREIQASDKEIRLATSIKALTDRERGAYKYFVDKAQTPIAEDKAVELYRLYQRGSTCEEIRRLFPSFSLGQIVAARVMGGWDERKGQEIKNLQKEVPAKVETTQLEVQEFLSNLLTASHLRFSEALKLYIATKDPAHLKDLGIPLPKTMKELRDLTELYMKVSGTDSKKVQVQVTGGVEHTMKQVSAAEAATIMDDLLGDNIQDAEFTESSAPKRIAAPSTLAETIEFLVQSGMPREKAEKVARGES